MTEVLTSRRGYDRRPDFPAHQNSPYAHPNAAGSPYPPTWTISDVHRNVLPSPRDQAVRNIEITFAEPVAAEPFAALTGVTGLNVHGTVLRCQLDGSPDALLRTAIRQHTVTGISATEPPLEDLFHRYYTGASRAA